MIFVPLNADILELFLVADTVEGLEVVVGVDVEEDLWIKGDRESSVAIVVLAFGFLSW